MLSSEDLLKSIQSAPTGLTIAEILALHPGLARRTAQRRVNALATAGKIRPLGEGRGRRYIAAAVPTAQVATTADDFPQYIPLSVDSRDILAYIDQPLAQRNPVGYQRDFLDAYQPNRTWYLAEPLRRQLRMMGNSGQTRLPAGTYGRAILSRLLIDLSWASSNLEGNTYSLLDTQELITHGRAAPGKAAMETQMILNHKAAIELIVENIGVADFDRFTLLNLHSALSENLLPNPADEGRLRQHGVEIGKSVYRPLALGAQISELLDVLLGKAAQITDPFEQSFFVMVHLPYLQPFADVNKRTSRLAANLSLIRSNLCPLTFLGVPEQAYSRAILGVYEMARVELLRDVYVWAYERSCQEYLVVKQDIVEPDPLRLAYRTLIRKAIREVVRQPARAPLDIIDECLSEHDPGTEDDNVKALILEELRRLHKGVLGRYGLRPSDYIEWKSRQ